MKHSKTIASKCRKSCRGDILFLSPTLWPQPDASAAGVRTSDLLNYFASSDPPKSFNQVHYGCGLKGDPPVAFHDVNFQNIPPNRSKKIKEFLQREVDLNTVVFDRFFSEEAYSFHFNKHRPDVLRVLDMQDMHALRYHREELIRKMDRQNKTGLQCYQEEYFVKSVPSATSYGSSLENSSQVKNPNSLLLRELSAIMRSDLTMVCSQYELDLLRGEYGIPQDKLVLASFFTSEDPNYFAPSMVEKENVFFQHCFHRRSDFVVLGGFKHSPNIDQVLMAKNLWPKIREKLPDAKIHIYGSYPPPRISQLHNKREGFLVHGYAKHLNEPLGESRVMLAPIRFGAGIKGKIIDAWRFGCPVVTTPIGAEGIGDYLKKWGGYVASDDKSFVDAAVKLYTNEKQWKTGQDCGKKLLNELFSPSNLNEIEESLVEARHNLENMRRRDYMSAMLWHNRYRSTEYFSKWIELKESQQRNLDDD